jgi:hypothetical protein
MMLFSTRTTSLAYSIQWICLCNSTTLQEECQDDSCQREQKTRVANAFKFKTRIL